MVKYRLTKKGKIVVVTFCTFIVLCFSLGSVFNNKDANNYYDYSRPNNDNQQQASKPNPPPVKIDREEPWEKLKVTVYFEANMASFNADYHDSLNIFTEEAKKHDDVKIQVEGNCATQFPESKKQKSINYNLSMLRAQAIVNYLKNNGINDERFIVVGNGSDKPLKDNSTPEGRKFNRRVDVFFVNE